MDNLDLNDILDRKKEEAQLIEYLNYFEENKHDMIQHFLYLRCVFCY